MPVYSTGEEETLKILVRFLVTSIAATAFNAFAAEPYPTKPVRLVVGFAAGGPTDVLTRVAAQGMSERVGQQFIVDNRTGAGGNIAAEHVAKAAPDGYTILVVVTAFVINPALYSNLPFNFQRDFVPVAGLARFSYVMAVYSGLPVKTVAELIAYAKANPGKVNFASAGVGGSNHLAVEIFKAMTGTDLVHVAYKGNSAAYADLVQGRVQLIVADRLSAAPHLQSGGLRPLAVTSTTRNEAMPNLPTVAETVPGYEASAFYGFAAPRGTPPDIVDKLSSTVNAVLSDPKTKARFAELDATPLVFTPKEFTAFLARESERWGEAVRRAGVKGQ
jgi:tripartite-type tricarboxylate transporter receptor subunit TctC